MKILFKYATRERPDWFRRTLALYYREMSELCNFQFLVSIDKDDSTMCNSDMFKFLHNKTNLIYAVGNNSSKIEAINADMESVSEVNWDILVVVSDDMVPVVRGYDKKIVDEMKKHFPDTDGALHFNDDMFGRDRCITLSIMGRKLYERLGYIYHPDYKSFFCDNEFTDVVYGMGKVVYIPQVIISHKSWHGGRNSTDSLYRRNSRMGIPDEAIYNKRRLLGFPKESVLNV